VNAILAGERPVRQAESTDPATLLAAAYELHTDALLAYVGTLTGRDSYATEDLVADVWLRVAEHMDRIDTRVLDLPWLQMIARSVAGVQAALPEEPVGLADDVRALDNRPAAADRQPAHHESDVQEQYRRTHGAVSTWSATDFEVYANLGTPAPMPAAAPVVVMVDEMAAYAGARVSPETGLARELSRLVREGRWTA
jgi:hypothetical protein